MRGKFKSVNGIKVILRLLFALLVVLTITKIYRMMVFADTTTATIGSISIAIPSGVTQANVSTEPTGIYLNQPTLTSGWYYVPADNLQLDYLNIAADSEINLILLDGHTLTIDDSLRQSSCTLKIWGQAEGTGKLIVNGKYDYALGNPINGYGIYVKNLIINGGNVTTIGKLSYGVGHGLFIDDSEGSFTYNDGVFIAASSSNNNDEKAISVPDITLNNNPFVKAGADSESLNSQTEGDAWVATLSDYKYVMISPSVTVSFDTNDGRSTMSSETINKGLYTLPPCTIKPPRNKEFDGWSLTSNGSKITTSSITLSQDTTLYPLWKEHTHTYKTTTVQDGVKKESCDCGFYIITYN